jgi:hypothetical protein
MRGMNLTFVRILVGALCIIAALAVAIAALAHPLWTVFWRREPLDTATFLILAGLSVSLTAAATILLPRVPR